MLAGTDDHLTWLSPVILNLENMGLTHLESEIRVNKSSLRQFLPERILTSSKAAHLTSTFSVVISRRSQG